MTPRDPDRMTVAVDVVLLTAEGGHLHTLVLERDDARGWALPGGFIRRDEPLEGAAARVLREKARLTPVFLEQLFTFGDPPRDPRERVISVAHFALIAHARLEAAVRSKPRQRLRLARVVVPWPGETGGPVSLLAEDGRRLPAAFDHAQIVGMAVKRLRGRLDYSPIGYQLLAESFTLLELRRVHETVLGKKLNKDSFRRRMLASGDLEATGAGQTGVEHRPAALYRFARRSAV